MRATGEVAWPVIGSTVTTLVAFYPMLYWPGIMGEFMRFLPITLIVYPDRQPLCRPGHQSGHGRSIFMKIKGSSEHRAMTIEEMSAAVDKPLPIKGFWTTLYSRTLTACLEKPWSVLGLSFAGLILMVESWLLVIGLEKPVEFFPEIDPKGFYVNIETPEGADLDFIDRIIQRVELAIAGVGKTESGSSAPPVSPLQALAPKEHRQPAGTRYFGPSDLSNVKDVYMQGVVSAGPGSAFSSNLPNRWNSASRTPRGSCASVRSRPPC